jgi:hypothetical protein
MLTWALIVLIPLTTESRMATHKAPGEDGLPMLQYCFRTGREVLLLLCNLVNDRECIPHGWREGILVSAPTSGDLTNCSNYRGLTLLPAISKLFTILLLQRVSPHVHLHDHQYGFRQGQSAADTIFALDATVSPRNQRGERTCLFFSW